MSKQLRHRWNRKITRKQQVAFCLECGLLKELDDKGKVFYFINDTPYYKASEYKCKTNNHE